MSPLTRRGFLAGLAAAGAVACSTDTGPGAASPGSTAPGTSAAEAGPVAALSAPPAPELAVDPFTLGVASGDPLPDAVVLWTRLVPEPASGSSGLAEPVEVVWEVGSDPELATLVATGTAEATAATGHSVHVDATGLAPATTYWYRFRAGDHTSPVGRTRTAPAADATPDTVRLAVANCQAYQTGYFTAYRHLADDDLDAVLFVGDYIYELETSLDVRPHGFDPPSTLDEYRRFYELNKTDADLRAAHAAHPWVFTWDDHEVEDNYAALVPGAIGRALGGDADFAAKRAAAYQAWWEHVPIRSAPPVDGELAIHRSFDFGDLVRLAVLDDRQYRSPLADPGPGALPRLAGGGAQVDEVFADDRTMLGAEQEAWLDETLRTSGARWTVLVQQTVMAQVDRAPDDPERGFSLDAWDGYVAPRNRLLGSEAVAGLRNLVSLGGDIHTSAVTDLLADYHADGATVVGTELIAPSISALEKLPPGAPEATLTAEHIHLYDIERRGYLRVEVSPDELRADYRWVATTAEPTSTIETGSRWVVRDGTPGAEPA